MTNTTNPCTSLYVGDLNPDVTEPILLEKFKPHGNVRSIRVVRDLVTRKSLCYAYVNFQTYEQAKSALDGLNFSDIRGCPCRIVWAKNDAVPGRSNDGNKFIKNLDSAPGCPNDGNKFIKNLDPASGRSNNGNKFIKTHNPLPRRSNGGNLYIKYLDPTLTVKDINDMFSIFGKIISCKVELDESGASRCFGFVNFAQPEDADRAIEALHGKMIRNETIYVAKFVPRHLRQSTISTEQQEDGTDHFSKPFHPQNSHVQQFNPMTDYMMHSPDQQMPFLKRQEQGISSSSLPNRNFSPHSRNKDVIFQPRPGQPKQKLKSSGPIVGNIQSMAHRPSPYSAMVGDRVYPRVGKHTDDMVSDRNYPRVGNHTDDVGSDRVYPRVGNHTDDMVSDRNYPRVGKHTDDMVSDRNYPRVGNHTDDMVSDRVYPRVVKQKDDVAGKITGMFLELDNVELMSLLRDEDRLRMKVEEAMSVISGHKTGGPPLR